MSDLFDLDGIEEVLEATEKKDLDTLKKAQHVSKAEFDDFHKQLREYRATSGKSGPPAAKRPRLPDSRASSTQHTCRVSRLRHRALRSPLCYLQVSLAETRASTDGGGSIGKIRQSVGRRLGTCTGSKVPCTCFSKKHGPSTASCMASIARFLGFCRRPMPSLGRSRDRFAGQ